MEKYDIKKVVGEGSYGKAILCRRKVDSKMCIIKQISIKKLSKKEALLTEQEATLLKRLQHPNIVRVKEMVVGSSIDKIYMVMEYCENDLKKCMQMSKQSFSTAEVSNVSCRFITTP